MFLFLFLILALILTKIVLLNDTVKKIICLQTIHSKQKRSTEGCSKFKNPETRHVQERLVSTLEHMQVPKWDRSVRRSKRPCWHAIPVAYTL